MFAFLFRSFICHNWTYFYVALLLFGFSVFLAIMTFQLVMKVIWETNNWYPKCWRPAIANRGLDFQTPKGWSGDPKKFLSLESSTVPDSMHIRQPTGLNWKFEDLNGEKWCGKTGSNFMLHPLPFCTELTRNSSTGVYHLIFAEEVGQQPQSWIFSAIFLSKIWKATDKNWKRSDSFSYGSI